MKVLVIPDVHLKRQIFLRASEWMKAGIADQAICLMDIADDWGLQGNDAAYEITYDAAVTFAKDYPTTLWCYGNHDVSYVWEQERHSGYSYNLRGLVCDKISCLREVLPNENQMAYAHRIDNVIFSHGGLTDKFVKENVPDSLYEEPDSVIRIINSLGCEEMWQDHSPIWHRPQYRSDTMYMGKAFLQVVGHTPVEEIDQFMNVLSCDVFGFSLNGKPSGSQQFAVVDTITKEYTTIEGKIKNERGHFIELQRRNLIRQMDEMDKVLKNH